jgi:tripeptidyl-peptidase-1
VVSYLKGLGVPSSHIKINPHGTFVTAHVPVSTANEAFGADFHVYRHPESKGHIVKTENAALPEELKGFVTHVPHVSYFPRVNHRVRFHPRPSPVDAAAGDVTPQLLSQYYGVSGQAQNGATQSVMEQYGGSFSNADLNKFQQTYGLAVHNITKIVGTNDEESCMDFYCLSGNMDTQYQMAMAPGADTTFWTISDSADDPYLDWSIQIAAEPNPPQVNSISYSDSESLIPPDTITSFNTEVQKLGLQGVSVVVLSGIDGVGGLDAYFNVSDCAYAAEFPGESPYVTTVGATQGPENGKTEIVCSSLTDGYITSGGGFSVTFPQPDYQKTQVAAYFTNVATAPAAGYNAAGRAYPDVSVVGFNYTVANGGELESADAGNAAVFAGMITLINDARLAAGKKPLGFLNQALYSLDASVWNDIVTGDNKCTSDAEYCCTEGFSAAKGWDPVSGLGSPKFQALKTALVAL